MGLTKAGRYSEAVILWSGGISGILLYFFRMASFDKEDDSDGQQYQKYPIRRLEPSIQKFLKVINIDLGRLHQHKLNIEKVSYCQHWWVDCF